MWILQYKDNRSHVGEVYGKLSVSDLYELQIATFVYKVFHDFNEVPTVSPNYFVTNDWWTLWL